MILLRFLAEVCSGIRCGDGLMGFPGVRKKLEGGGVSGGLSLGRGRMVIGCGSLV